MGGGSFEGHSGGSFRGLSGLSRGRGRRPHQRPPKVLKTMLQSLGQVYDSAVMIHTTFEFININCLLIPQSLCVRHSLVCGNEMTPIGQLLRIKLDQIKQSLLLKVNILSLVLVIFFRNISLFDDRNSFPHPPRASPFCDDDSKHHNEDKYSTAQCGCNNFF